MKQIEGPLRDAAEYAFELETLALAQGIQLPDGNQL